MSRYKSRLQITIRFMFNYFWTQVYATAFDIGLNISLEI